MTLITHLHQCELAKRWALSPRTLERWRWLGRGPKFLKTGGRVVYRLVDIEEYEAKNVRSSTSEGVVAHPFPETLYVGDWPECRG